MEIGKSLLDCFYINFVGITGLKVNNIRIKISEEV